MWILSGDLCREMKIPFLKFAEEGAFFKRFAQFFHRDPKAFILGCGVKMK